MHETSSHSHTDSQAPLRACPTCTTPVDEAKLGLRDYRWLSGLLPGKVGGSDVDLVLHHRDGRALALEFKPWRTLPYGQKLMFEWFDSVGVDVYLVVDKDLEKLEVARVRAGTALHWRTMTLEDLQNFVRNWWDLG